MWIKMSFHLAKINETIMLYEFRVDLFLAPWNWRHLPRWNSQPAAEHRYPEPSAAGRWNRGSLSAEETQRTEGLWERWCSNWLGWWGKEAHSRNKCKCWGGSKPGTFRNWTSFHEARTEAVWEKGGEQAWKSRQESGSLQTLSFLLFMTPASPVPSLFPGLRALQVTHL